MDLIIGGAYQGKLDYARERFHLEAEDLAFYENGYDNISVYDGGWYEWLMHDDYPVQVGDPASDECVHTTVGEVSTGKAAK